MAYNLLINFFKFNKPPIKSKQVACIKLKIKNKRKLVKQIQKNLLSHLYFPDARRCLSPSLSLTLLSPLTLMFFEKTNKKFLKTNSLPPSILSFKFIVNKHYQKTRQQYQAFMNREMIKGQIKLIIGSRPTIWKMKVSWSFLATTRVWFHASNGDMFAFG